MDERRIIYPPDSIKSTYNDNFAYNSLFFDEERFGMESYGFIKKLAGNDLYVGVTKFKMKTCACKTSGGYFKGYFIVTGDNYIKLKTAPKNRILNLQELNDFIESNGFDIEIPPQVQYVDELVQFFNNISQ